VGRVMGSQEFVQLDEEARALIAASQEPLKQYFDDMLPRLSQPVEDADDFAQWMLESFSHNGETVMVAPASGFYSQPELGKKQVRIAYVLKSEDLKRSVELLKLALEKYNNK
jgi:aspartate/methionine/tyrosine aminotransferase